MTEPSEALDDLPEDGEEACAIVITAHDPLPGIAAARNVIDRMGKFETKRSRHGGRLLKLMSDCKT